MRTWNSFILSGKCCIGWSFILCSWLVIEHYQLRYCMCLSSFIKQQKPIRTRGQQISWMAAKSITHRFKRLYDPTLPEKPGQVAYVIQKVSKCRRILPSQRADSFPTPAQVAATELSTLRTAGLSTRKAEYSASQLTWIEMSWYPFCSSRSGQAICRWSLVDAEDTVR